MSKKNLTVILAIAAIAVFVSVQVLYWTVAFWAWMVDTTVAEFAIWWFLCAVPATVATVIATKHGHLMKPEFQGGAATYWWLCFGLTWGTAGWIIGAVSMALVIANVAVYRKLAA